MLSFKIREEISNMLALFDDAQYFFECLENINSAHSGIEQSINNIAVNGDVNHPNKLRSHLSNVKNIANVTSRIFFSSIDKLRDGITEISEHGFNDISQLNKISEKLHHFGDTYNEYVDNGYRADLANILVMEAKELSSLLEGFKDGLNFYLLNIESPVVLEKKNETKKLSLVLSSQMNLSEFASKLHSIELIYNELCSLMDVSTAEFPIQIIKIESGSLLADLLGNAAVIGVVTSIITTWATFAYENYTIDGQISAMPKKAEAIASLLDLSNKLKDQGIEVDDLNDNINKSSVALAKRLNNLISNQAEITINANKLSVGNEDLKKLIEHNAPLKLEFDETAE